MMQSGFSRELFEMWCSDKRNGLMMPGYSVAGTLAHHLISEPKEITTSTARAEKKKAEVQSVKDMLAGEAEVIGEDKRAVEEDLLAAKPALDEAEAALSAITAKDIGMLKALKKPPNGVKLTLKGVCIMFQIKPQKVADPDNPTKKVDDYFGPASKMLKHDTL